MCEVKGFRIGPFTSSFGTKMPFDFDFRRLFGQAQALSEIGRLMARIVKKYKVDLIAGGETAGIPIAASVAIAAHLPMIYIRKKLKGHGVPRQIEGLYKKRMTVALVDDTLYTGRQKELFVNILKNHDLKVKCIVTLAGSLEKKYDWMNKNNIKLHFLCDRWQLRDYMHQKGAIPEKVYQIAREAYSNNWSQWCKNPQNWKNFYRLLKDKSLKPYFN